MKKLLSVMGAVIFCLLISKISFGETVGNTVDVNYPAGKGVYSSQLNDFIKLNIGFDTDVLLEKKFKYDSAVTSSAPKLKGQYYMAKVSCTLFSRIQPYLTVGASHLKMSWSDKANGAVDLQANIAPAWGAGVKAYLWEFEGMGLKVFSTASFRSTRPTRMESLTTNRGSGNITQSSFKVLERQGSLGISKEIKPRGWENVSFVPYAGVVYSSTTARITAAQSGNSINAGAKGQKDNVGLFLGTDFMIMDNLSLNVEGRFIDQEEVSAGFTALF